jgi:flavin-dependent dehydrogenase
MKLEKRITYYADGQQLWSYKDLAKKYDISDARVRFYVNDAEFAFTRPREVARTGNHAQAVVLFNADELDAWFAPQAESIRANIERGRGRPRKN